MIIDSHNHMGGPDRGDGASQSASEIIARMDRAGVDRAVVFPFNEIDPGISFSNANNNIIEEISKYPDRLIGWARLDPGYGDEALSELERSARIGLSGIKLHPKAQNFNPQDEYVFKIIEEASGLGLPVVFDNGKEIFSNSEIANLASLVEESVIILAHLRGRGLLEAALENENVYLGTVKSPVPAIEKVLEKIEPSRIIAGSDSPYASMRYEMNDKFREIEILTDRDRELICGENIERILGL